MELDPAPQDIILNNTPSQQKSVKKWGILLCILVLVIVALSAINLILASKKPSLHTMIESYINYIATGDQNTTAKNPKNPNSYYIMKLVSPYYEGENPLQFFEGASSRLATIKQNADSNSLLYSIDKQSEFLDLFKAYSKIGQYNFNTLSQIYIENDKSESSYISETIKTLRESPNPYVSKYSQDIAIIVYNTSNIVQLAKNANCIKNSKIETPNCIFTEDAYNSFQNSLAQISTSTQDAEYLLSNSMRDYISFASAMLEEDSDV